MAIGLYTSLDIVEIGKAWAIVCELLKDLLVDWDFVVTHNDARVGLLFLVFLHPWVKADLLYGIALGGFIG